MTSSGTITHPSRRVPTVRDGGQQSDRFTGPSARPKPGRGRVLITRTPYYVITLGLAIIFLYPLVWTAIMSVAPQPGSAQVHGWGFGNYAALGQMQFGLYTYVLNSVILTLTCVVVTLVAATFGGYAFARFDFPGKNILFLVTLAIMMIPAATLLLPMVVWLNELGLTNNLVSTGIVMAIGQLPFAIFMMRISFESIPREMEEAALIDGCTSWGALRRVLIHGVKPGLLTVGLFAFLAAWNDLITPLYLLGGRSQPLPLAIANMRVAGGTLGVINFGATQAGIVIMAIPCLILFLILQRHYVSGFMSGALKG